MRHSNKIPKDYERLSPAATKKSVPWWKRWTRAATLGLSALCFAASCASLTRPLPPVRGCLESPPPKFEEKDDGVYLGGERVCAAEYTLCLDAVAAKRLYGMIVALTQYAQDAWDL